MYVTVRSKDLQVGDRVYFVENKFARYTIKSANPLKGTEYECAGTVIGFEYSYTRVRWDNGHENAYTDHTLAKTETMESHIISIW